MEQKNAHNLLVPIVRELAKEKHHELDRLKQEYSGIMRPDFIWHYLLQSFSTMGGASGWHGLIGNKNNYNRITYNVLSTFDSADREIQVRQVCREAKIRMPDKKADYILGCYTYVKQLGGLEAAKAKLLEQPGCEAKILFLQTFPGIGPKYARNIMMDVYHEDFRNSIAIDVRIKAISDALGLSFRSYAEHESFYLNVARDAGINGWELDRLLFNFRGEVESRLGLTSYQ
jgi:thermostable 8-oxoguanine DNA glycosylase